MNSVSCMVRIIEIPRINLFRNGIPWSKFRIEIAQDSNHQNYAIVDAKIWGDLAYDLCKYYRINDYLLVEGYFSIRSSKFRLDKKKIASLTIFQIYPYFLTC